jgi:hypothetical protein
MRGPFRLSPLLQLIRKRQLPFRNLSLGESDSPCSPSALPV